MKVNGKIFTIVFAVAIGGLLLFGFSVSNRQNELAELIAKQRALWPQAAETLEPIFVDVDRRVTEEGFDESRRSHWVQLRKDYLRSTVYDDQAKLFGGLAESTIELSSSSDPKSAPAPAEIPPSIASFTAVDRQREALESDLIGKITKKTLFLRYPPLIYQEVEALAKLLRQN